MKSFSSCDELTWRSSAGLQSIHSYRIYWKIPDGREICINCHHDNSLLLYFVVLVGSVLAI